jgi:hypothetical protein
MLKLRYLAPLVVAGVVATSAYAFTNSLNVCAAEAPGPAGNAPSVPSAPRPCTSAFYAAEADAPVRGCTATNVTWDADSNDPENVVPLHFTLNVPEVELCLSGTGPGGCTGGSHVETSSVDGSCVYTLFYTYRCDPAPGSVPVTAWTGFELAVTNFQGLGGS